MSVKVLFRGEACLHWTPGTKAFHLYFGNSLAHSPDWHADIVRSIQQWVRQLPQKQSDRAERGTDLAPISCLKRLQIAAYTSSHRAKFQRWCKPHQEPRGGGVELEVCLARQQLVRLRVHDLVFDANAAIATTASSYTAAVSLNIGSIEVFDLLQEASLYPLLLAMRPALMVNDDCGARMPGGCAIALTLLVSAEQHSDPAVEFSAVMGNCRFVVTPRRGCYVCFHCHTHLMPLT